jgi:hypothetical protein
MSYYRGTENTNGYAGEGGTLVHSLVCSEDSKYKE